MAANTVLLGRRAELTALRDLAEQARGVGDVRVAVVTGESGMGKTTLLQQFLSYCDGAAILHGECLDLGSARLPYGPIVQALRPVLRDPAAWGLELDEPARANLARLLPLLGDASPVPSGRFGGVEVGQTQLYEHLLGVVEEAARSRPLLVLALEDVHFCEPATRDLIAFLAGNLAAVPILLVLTVRGDEVGRRHPVWPLLNSLERSPRASTIELTPLDRATLAELMGPLVGADLQWNLDELLDRAGGNPLFATELAAGGGVTGKLSDLLLARVDRCDAATQRVLGVAAAAREDVEHAALFEVTGLAEARLTECLREAIDERLIVVTGDRRYRFRHSLIREAVEESLLPGEVVAIHSALADRLGADGGNRGRNAARLARHYRAGGRQADELEAGYAAGRHAFDLVAYGDAQVLFERVAELWPLVPDAEARTGTDLAEVYRTAAVCAISVLDHRRGVALAKRALDHVDPDHEPERAALIHVLVGNASDNDWPEAERALRTAVATVPAGDSPARARVEAALARALMLEGHTAEAAELAEHAAAVARRVGATEDEAEASITLATLEQTKSQTDAERLFEVGRRAAEAAGRIDLQLRGANNRTYMLWTVGRFTDAIAEAERGIAIARTYGLDRSYGAVLGAWLIELPMLLGRLDEAASLGRSVAATAPEGLPRAGARAYLGLVDVRRGEIDAAIAHEQEATRQTGTTSQPQYLLDLARLRCEISLATGDHRRALSTALDALHQSPDALGPPTRRAVLAVLAAEAVRVDIHHGADDLRRIVEIATRSEQQFASPLTTSARLHVEAIAAESWDPAEAVPAWERARAAYEALSMPFEEARCALAIAELTLANGDRPAARQAWTQAWQLPTAMGARRLATAAAAFGRRAGFAADQAPTIGYGLTARELDVLRLVADGRSNGEIGQQLFISVKTASVHVSHILAKMGVSTRQQAAALAHRDGLIG